MNATRLDLSALEVWLWSAALTIRDPVDAPKVKGYILPLVFLKRLSDVFEDEVKQLSQELGDEKLAAKYVEDDHKLVRFYIPPEARWPAIRQQKAGLGEYLTEAMRKVARENPKLQGVIDVAEFDATVAGQRVVDDDRLAALVDVLSRHRLGLNDVEPDILGRAYEYLLRNFAQGQGQVAGEFYTPREVGALIARLMEPEPGEEIYDPACGSGSLLIECYLRLLEKYGERQGGSRRLPPQMAPPKFYGQEINPFTYAVACMNTVIYDMEAEIALGDTIARPAFKDIAGRLQQFNVVVANPMWNQRIPVGTYEQDPFKRFHFGVPPSTNADWGWVQHMVASLKDGGRLAVVLDGGAVSRGTDSRGPNRERDIRRAFVEADLVDAVVLLAENLFYNTTAPCIILLIRKGHRPHSGQVLLVNASKLFSKGRPKNYLTDEHIAQIAGLYHDWKAAKGLAAIVTKDELARNDYNLSPRCYVANSDKEEVLPLEEAMVLLREAEEERAEADRELEEVLQRLGLGGLRDG